MTHLRLVKPPGEAPAPARRHGVPSAALSLTAEEARALRASIRNVVRLRYGTIVKLAAALGVVPSVLTRKRHPSPGLAVALGRLTGIPVETLLRPTIAALPSPAEGGAA